jgi:ornithine cyclodeaminase/alanine dehydrogenase-like protein (mu-crystallin family)
VTLLLSNDEVDRLLSMRECIDALDVAYRELAAGRGTDRRRSDSFVAGPVEGSLYSLKSMDGIAPAFGVGAVRIDSDVVTWPTRSGNARREKLPRAAGGRWVGLVLLFSIETGEPLAILPDGYLQRLRVGATNGLAADRLARADARTVGLLGSGWQAGGQLMAICAVRPVERVRCYSTSPERRSAFAREWSTRCGVEIEPVGSPDEAVRAADVVMCATNTIDNVFFSRWVEPGMHLSSIKRPEIEPAAIKRADRVVIHARDATPMHVAAAGVDVPEVREGRGWKLLSEIDFSVLPELHDVVAGTATGRTRSEEVTCFLNNIGRGYQFAAAGGALYRKAVAAGAGREIPTEWLTQDVHP